MSSQNLKSLLTGYKGTTFLTGRYIYSPYIPLHTTPAVYTSYVDILEVLGVRGFSPIYNKHIYKAAVEGIYGLAMWDGKLELISNLTDPQTSAVFLLSIYTNNVKIHYILTDGEVYWYTARKATPDQYGKMEMISQFGELDPHLTMTDKILIDKTIRDWAEEHLKEQPLVSQTP